MKPPVFSCLSSRVLNNGSLYGRFLFGPLPIDISLTIATILRRSLLHTKANLYIISAEIEGATHEYASLPGIQESVLEILLNLGEIVLASKKQNLVSWTKNFPSSVSFFGNRAQPHQSPLTALLQISGPCVVKAKDISWPKGVWCVKPNMPIATLSNNQTLAMRLKIMPILKQNSSNSFDVGFGLLAKHPKPCGVGLAKNKDHYASQDQAQENSESFSTSPNESGPFRTESSSRELKPKDSTWLGLMAPNTPRNTALVSTSGPTSFRASDALAQRTISHASSSQPVWGQVVPKISRRSETLKELSSGSILQEGGPLGQIKSSGQNQRPESQINSKFWPSKSVWDLSKAYEKSEGLGFSPISRKKAEDFITKKGITSTMLLEDREQQSATVRRPLPKWNKEGFLLKQVKEVETLTNSKQYLSSSQTALPRQLNFAQKNETKFDESPTSRFSGPSFEPQNFSNKISGKELTSKASKHIEGHNKEKCIELVVSPSTYPVEKVNFLIERDDQLAGYRHRIIFEVWTNGSISPRQAIFDSIGWILKLLYNFRQPSI